jgi:outer membrane lipoprotein LolB
MAALAAALTVAGCAALPPDTGGPGEAPSMPFDLSGRVLVSYDGRAFSSGLRWQHGPGRDEIWLLTPVGQTLAHIVNEADGATLTGADQRQYRAASVDSLTRQGLGWELPLARLQYWVRGEIAPGSAPGVVERDANQRLIRLEQDGWRVVFANYPVEEHGGLPRRLDLARDTHEIRLVIDAWRRSAVVP